MNLTLYWPPIEDGNNLQAARKRLLIVFCILSSVGSILPVVFKYIGLADPTPTQIGVALLGCLYYQFCPLLIAKRINTSLLAYIFVGSAFISASLKATQTGGIFIDKRSFIISHPSRRSAYTGLAKSVRHLCRDNYRLYFAI